MAQAKTVKLGSSFSYEGHKYSDGSACDAFAVLHFPVLRGPDGKEAAASYTATFLNSGSSETRVWSPGDDDYQGVTAHIKAGGGEHIIVVGDNGGAGSCAGAISGVERYSNPEVVASFNDGHLLSGTVTDESDKPVAGAEVDVSGASTSHTRTDAGGRYAFALPSGTYKVAVAKLATRPREHVVQLQGTRRGVDFRTGPAQVEASFSPNPVAGDGYGKTVMKLRITDIDGQPMAGQEFYAGFDLHEETSKKGDELFGETFVACQGPKLVGLAKPEFYGVTDANGEWTGTVYAPANGGSGREWHPDVLLIHGSSDKFLRARTSLKLLPFKESMPTLVQLRYLYYHESGPNIDIENAPLASQLAVLEWLNGLRFNHRISARLNAARSVDHLQRPVAPLVELDTDGGIRILDLPKLPDSTGSPDLLTPDEWDSEHSGLSYNLRWFDESDHAPADHPGEPPRYDWAFSYDGFYPPPPRSADRSAWNGCFRRLRPASHQLETFQLHSPARLLFTDSLGRHFGFDAHGKRYNEIPGALLSPGSKPQVYSLPAGRYQVVLSATGKGPVTLAASAPGRRGDAIRVFELKVLKGQVGSFAVNGASLPATISFAGRRYRGSAGLQMHVVGLPIALAKSRQVRLRLIDQFGRAVAGALITARNGKRSAVNAITDASGRAKLRLEPHQRVRITASGYLTLTARVG